MKATLLILNLAWLTSACTPAALPRPLPPYRPLWSEVGLDTTAVEKDTLRGDFARAQHTVDWTEAAALWSEFLKNHDPGEAGYEDAIHVRLVLLARMELMRSLYTLGRIAEADALARQIGNAAMGEKESP
jgi:hypothetical protein